MANTNLDLLVDIVKKTTRDLGEENLNQYHMLFGIVTEAGELLDIFKKKLAYEKEIDWVNVKEELGDLLFYIVGFCIQNDIDISEIAFMVHGKLSSRYPDGFSANNALNRDLEKERCVLEQNENRDRMLKELGY